jgi:hypothetical protein
MANGRRHHVDDDGLDIFAWNSCSISIGTSITRISSALDWINLVHYNNIIAFIWER